MYDANIEPPLYFVSIYTLQSFPKLQSNVFKSVPLILITIPAGIIDSAEAQVKLNLNEWVCTDMNVC